MNGLTVHSLSEMFFFPGAFPHLGGLVEELQDHHRGAQKSPKSNPVLCVVFYGE